LTQVVQCFLTNVSSDVYPFKLAKSTSGIQEERRVFYTVATRAEHKLVITSRMTTKNKNHFKIEPNRSYCFLNDIKLACMIVKLSNEFLVISVQLVVNGGLKSSRFICYESVPLSIKFKHALTITVI
jgi:hypothetical protein